MWGPHGHTGHAGVCVAPPWCLLCPQETVIEAADLGQKALLSWNGTWGPHQWVTDGSPQTPSRSSQGVGLGPELGSMGTQSSGCLLHGGRAVTTAGVCHPRAPQSLHTVCFQKQVLGAQSPDPGLDPLPAPSEDVEVAGVGRQSAGPSLPMARSEPLTVGGRPRSPPPYGAGPGPGPPGARGAARHWNVGSSESRRTRGHAHPSPFLGLPS